MELKRKADVGIESSPKRSRTEVVTYNQKGHSIAIRSDIPDRTSGLLAPIMQLTGHQGEILCGKFHPDGELLITSGMDRQIMFWNVYGECDNLCMIQGHTNAITDMCFSPDGSVLYTSSADKIVMCWDTRTAQRVKKLKGHTSFINSVHAARRGPPMIVSGGDDCVIHVWDQRKKRPVSTLQNTFQVTSVTFNDTADQVISGGVDNELKIWDLRKNAALYKMKGHSDTVTSLSLSPDGSHVLSNSYDNTIRIWDVRPYAPQERCIKIFQGHQQNFEGNLIRCSWTPDGRRVGSGSADRFVYIWDTASRHILYKLPGHNATVNSVEFHPKEPIVMSVSSDKTVYLGELE